MSEIAKDMIVQYILIRGDLLRVLKWPFGAVIAQACHGCTAVTHLYYDDEYTQEYLKDINNMHKIVLEVPDENAINDLAHYLEKNHIKHKLWMEQPENIPTCLIVKPYPKSLVQSYFKKLKLFKGNME
ncbi:putative peptidyl-tRNA hydrolase PTRHD1 [Cimex lectularius]|uniref:peptidyl-tRNA hydrolase n=1 Tax=Cimex lectularius TaxID=79782 RepID=A0A8I6SEU9_CIMLE|nr:putative peptidyl-tRNA hydrolase PTRHD1 [Cimex lectularius]XP_024080878.1 putative peptidyl-tRNA hydrolase PTRHD1 [Cimex lectularius]XP_024080879.1 putative peptidyl-tRNA hydrolase PTRHD1 [Cimex lectularius]